MRGRYIFSLLDCGQGSGIVHDSRKAIDPLPIIAFELQQLSNKFKLCGSRRYPEHNNNKNNNKQFI